MHYRKKPVVIEALQWDGSYDMMETINARLELRKLAEAATLGPWSITSSKDSHWMREVRAPNTLGVAWCGHETSQAHKDAAYIAAANPSKVIELLDTTEAQAKQLEELNLKLISSFGETQNALDRVAALRNIVTNDTETKAGFIARVRAILGKGNA